MAAFTYKKVYDDVATDGGVQRQATVAGVRAALDIYVEADTTPGHDQRKALATRVLNDPDAFALRFALICCVDPTIVTAGNKNLNDVDVLAAVKAAWNALSGA